MADAIVKKPYTNTVFKGEEQLLEFYKCAEDPKYFIENFCKIKHPTKGLIPFKLYDYQHDFVDGFMSYRKIVLNCGRQLGKTETSAAFLLWKAMFTPDTTILITANKYVQALEIMDRVSGIYANVPDHIRAGATESNKGTLAFDNGSKIVSRATSKDAGRGLAISLLYCLSGDSTVTVRDKLTGAIQNVSLKELYETLNGQSDEA